TGMTISKAAMRKSGSRKLATQPPICASLSASMSADQLRNVVDQPFGELHQLGNQPGPEHHQGNQHHQQTRQKAQGLFVDLRGGLIYGSHLADNLAGYYADGDDQRGQPERFTKQVNSNFRGHACPSLKGAETA